MCRGVNGSAMSQISVSYMIRSQPEANEFHDLGYYFYSDPTAGAGLLLATGLGPWVGMRGKNLLA